MTRVEDLVRSTTTAIASTVRDVPPLRLSLTEGDVLESPRSTSRAHWAHRARRLPILRPPIFPPPARLAPAAAAAAVLVLALTLVIIRDLPNGRAVPPAAPASTSTDGVPKYYVAPETACKTCQSTNLVVGETLTGTKLATFSPPDGTTFAAASAAADDRTFVVDTVEFPTTTEAQHVTWYLLKITPDSSSPARLTRLPIPATPTDASVGAIALSASGRELAVAFQVRSATTATTVLRIYSVATGKLLHSWSTDQNATLFRFSPYVQSNKYVQSNNQLNWVDGDRALSFATGTIHGKPTAPTAVDFALRTLDVTASGGDLIRDSRVVWSWSTGRQETDPSCADPHLTASGKTVVCSVLTVSPTGVSSGKARYTWQLAWLAYEISAPKAAAGTLLYMYTAYSTGPETGLSSSTLRLSSSSVQWADASGSTVIVGWSVASPVMHFGVVTQGKLIPLPSLPGITLDILPNTTLLDTLPIAW